MELGVQRNAARQFEGGGAPGVSLASLNGRNGRDVAAAMVGGQWTRTHLTAIRHG